MTDDDDGEYDDDDNDDDETYLTKPNLTQTRGILSCLVFSVQTNADS